MKRASQLTYLCHCAMGPVAITLLDAIMTFWAEALLEMMEHSILPSVFAFRATDSPQN